MDVIQLAALSPETPVITALQVMRSRKQLGVICVQRNGNLFLAKAEDVGRALGRKTSTLGEVDGLVPVSRRRRKIRPSLDFTVGFRGFNTPSDTGDLGSTLEAEIQSDYVLSTLSGEEASIVTGHETIKIALEGDPSRPNCSCNTGFHDIELYIGMTCPKHGCPVT